MEFSPDELRDCENLQFLSVGSNLFYGFLPSGILSLRNLEFLPVYDNFFTGCLLPDILCLSSLKYFEVSQNKLSGDGVQKVSVSANNLTGSIPASIRSCRNLDVVDLRSKGFSGNIPPAIMQ